MSTKRKSGAQFRKDRSRRDLLSAASQPGQKKICFAQFAATTSHDLTLETTSHYHAEIGEPDIAFSNDANFEIQPDTVDVDPTLIQPDTVDVDPTLIQPDTVDGDPTLIQPVTVHNFPYLETVAQCEDGIGDSGELDSDLVTALAWPTKRQDKLDLLEKQPQQPTCHIPFSVDIYYLTQIDGSDIQRKWLTYVDKKLYCKICGCFSSIRFDDFVLGIGKENFRRASQLVKRHEVSQHHTDASDCYFRNLQRNDITSLIPGWKEKADSDARRKVEQNRQILARVIDIIKLIAGQGLPYRGESESARDLLDTDTNKRRGNFLEIVLLVSKYDPLLSAHVAQCSERGQQQRKGRGSAITFLSKTTVNNIIRILAELIQEQIVKTINSDCNQKYGIMMDGTVDISGTDQLNIVARFVRPDGKVQERLLGFEVITSGKGEALWKLLVGKLEKLGLDIKTLIGLSLDGASANTSENVGVVKYYYDEVPLGYFVWGFAHQQNLMVAPVFSEIKETRNLMGLLQETCSFFNESSRRVDVWKKWVQAHCHGTAQLKRMVKLGKTRWWSSYKAIKRVFDKPTSYYILIGVLWELSTSTESTAATKILSDGLLTRFLSFTSVLTGTVLKRMLRICDPVTKYLQTRGLEISQAVQLVEFEKNVLSTDRSKFTDSFQAANEFRQQVQELVDRDDNPDFDVILEQNLPTATVTRKRRRFFDENASDDHVTSDPKEKFRLDVFLPIVDRLTGEISTRFNERNSDLYSEIAWLNPSNYKKITDTSSFSMRHLAELAGVDELELKQELIHFAQYYSFRAESCSNSSEDSDSERDLEQEPNKQQSQSTDVDIPFCKGNCSNCLGCVLSLLFGYRFYCTSYNKLYKCLRIALTLPCTVVTCERVFSKLRFIKDRLRSLLGQELLEALLICSVEVDMLKSIDNESVYRKLSSISPEMEKRRNNGENVINSNQSNVCV